MNQLILSNYDIEEIYPFFKIKLLFCNDYHQLNNITLQDGSYILNLGNTHWCALFVKNKQGCYFDSYGQIYPNEIKTFCPNVIYNDDIIQSLNSIYCGFYCLFFLYYMTNKYKYSLQYTLNIFRSLFSDDENSNDKILQKHIKIILKS